MREDTQMRKENTYGLSDGFVKELCGKYGSPLYLFDKAGFVENYNHLLDAFRKIYPKYNIAYSYKTNYTPYICKLVKELGGYAEVVSGMEYRLARKIGYESSGIVFNGPVKGNDLLEHLDLGGVANIDHLDELNTVLAHAKKNTGKQYELAFRVNIDIDQSFVSRFGIDADNGDLDKAFSLVAEAENVAVVGIHCHIGRSRSLQAWKNRVQIMFDLVDKYFSDPPRFIDLGSGMNSVMEPALAKQFGGDIPNFAQYADVVATAFAEKYGNLPTDKQPELITEPGTTLVSGQMRFLSTVLSIKTVKGKVFATFDGSGGNMGDICHLKQLPITLHHFDGVQQTVSGADFVGYTCLEHDVMYKDYTGMLTVGDIVEFRNVGSYSNVFKPPFIYPNCAMAVLEEDGGSQLIKQRETMEYIFETYVF